MRAVNGGRRRVVLPANPREQVRRTAVTVCQKKQVDRNGTLDPVLNQGNLVNYYPMVTGRAGVSGTGGRFGGAESPVCPAGEAHRALVPSRSLAVTMALSLPVMTLLGLRLRGLGTRSLRR